MLTCQELSERATEYLENALNPGQLAAVKMHLLMCKHCRAYVDQLARTIKLLHAAGEQMGDATPVDPEMVARFRAGNSGSHG